MSGSRLSPQLLLALVTLALQWPEETTAIITMPLSSLFDNAVVKAENMHQLATKIFMEFESTYISEDQRQPFLSSLSCTSATLRPPTEKDEVLKKTDLELLGFSLLVIEMWLIPVKNFVRVFDSLDNIHEKIYDLGKDILLLMLRLQDENSRGDRPIMLLPNYDTFGSNTENKESLLKNYGLLSCFKKDLHMVETYLKVMKSRHPGEN